MVVAISSSRPLPGRVARRPRRPRASPSRLNGVSSVRTSGGRESGETVRRYTRLRSRGGGKQEDADDAYAVGSARRGRSDPPSVSWAEALARPGLLALRAPEGDAVVEAARAALPELDHGRGEAVAAPEVRERHGLAVEAAQELVLAGLEVVGGRDDGALARDPGADLARARARVEVRLRLRGASCLDASPCHLAQPRLGRRRRIRPRRLTGGSSRGVPHGRNP